MDFIKDNIKKIILIVVLIFAIFHLTGCASFKEGFVEGHNSMTSEDMHIKPESTNSEDDNSSEAQGEN